MKFVTHIKLANTQQGFSHYHDVMNCNTKYNLATNILYTVTTMKLKAMCRNDKEVHYAEETVQCTQFWDETYLSYSMPPWILIFMPSQINTCAIFTLLPTAVNYTTANCSELHCCQLQWTTLLPTAVNYTAANCSELQMLISIADFIFRENQMFKIIWALTSGCGSCIIWLMLSYFFSLSSYLTDNILNLIRTLPPTPTYTAQNSFNLPQTWQPDLTSLGNWGVTHSHNSIIYETTSKQSYQLTLKIWM